MTDFNDLFQEQMQDPEFRKEYEALKSEVDSYIFHRAASVETLPDCCLRVVFLDGVVRTYDLKKLFDELPQLKALADDPVLFASARLDPGGYGIIWNDELDLDCNEVYVNGE